eukprot:jgi/Antlo1/1803/565
MHPSAADCICTYSLLRPTALFENNKTSNFIIPAMVAALFSFMLHWVASIEHEATTVDITGLSRALVFAELYNNARRSRPWHLRKRMTVEEANTLVGRYVDEIYGVKMNIYVPREDEESKLDARAYNEANEDGYAEKVIENLKRKVCSGDVYGNNQRCTEMRSPHFNREDCVFFCKACAVCVGATAVGAAVGAGSGACCGAIVGASTSPYLGAILGTCIMCGTCVCACCDADVCTVCVGIGFGAVYGAIIGSTLGPAAVAATGAVVAGAGIGACVGATSGSGLGASASVVLANHRNNKEENPKKESSMHNAESPGAENTSQDTETVTSAQSSFWKETRV